MRAAALALVALLIAGCGSGGSGGGVPRGNPDARHGPAAVDDYAAVELLRARLIASSDSYYAGGSAADARLQLERARAAYDGLAPRVKAKDAVVDREVVARFDTLARAATAACRRRLCAVSRSASQPPTTHRPPPPMTPRPGWPSRSRGACGGAHSR